MTPHLDWNFEGAVSLGAGESRAQRVHERSEDRAQSGPRSLRWRDQECKASHETKVQIWFRLFFKAQNQYFNDWAPIPKPPSGKNPNSRKSQKRKTSFSLQSGLLSKRKGSRPLQNDGHAFEEERASIQSGFRNGRQVIPTDRDSIMNANNKRDSIIPTLSNRIASKPDDPNYAWID